MKKKEKAEAGNVFLGSCRAISDYEPTSESELRLVKGLEISVLIKNDDGWWFGMSPGGERGYFPVNFTDAWTDEAGERIFVESEKLDEEPELEPIGSCRARAAYTAEAVTELSFGEGDEIIVLKRNDNGWWYGKLDGKDPGYFPVNYTDGWKEAQIVAEKSGVQIDVASDSEEDDEYESIGVCTGRLDYVPHSESELGFEKGDRIVVFVRNDDGWWYGKLRGKCGYFPSGFVTELAQQ